MKSFDRCRNDVDLNSGSLRTIDDNWDISSINSSSSSYVYEGLRKDSNYVSQRTRRSYDWKRMDRRQQQQQQEGEMIRRSSDERDKVAYSELNPSELLKRLDELKDQINRSCQVNEKPPYPNQTAAASSSYMDRLEMDIHRFYQPAQQFSHHSSSSSQSRREGDLSSGSVGFSQNGHRIPSGRRCYPIAGGSPFVTCYNCFELLQVPKKLLFLETNQKKMQCGACLTVLLLEVVNKKLFVSASVSEFPSHISNEEAVGDSLPSHHQTVNEGSSLINGNMIQEESELKHSSDDSEHDLQDMNGGEPTTSSSIHTFNSGKSASSHSSMDFNNTPEKNSDDFAEIIPITVKPPPPKGSSLQDYFDYSNIYRKADQFDEGNQGESSEKDLGMPKKAFLQEDSTKDASLATEIDVSFQYTISTTSQESRDSSIDGRSITNKGHQQKSFRDQDTIISVTINGKDVPDHLLKKAEIRAGPIQPGNYWYDFSAGFWGVMGGPCLGIIPPFIEELNYPMDVGCAGGETGVFVNGRELHPKDFDRLCSRGLPRATNRSYDIEISGKVFDGISGEQLKGLGRLAPSVEKSKRGFGMKPPRKAGV